VHPVGSHLPSVPCVHGADAEPMGGCPHLTDGILLSRRQLHAGRAGEEVVRDGHQDAGAVA